MSMVCFASSFRSLSSLRLDQNVVPLGVLVAFDNLVLRDLLKTLLGRNPLHVSNGLA
jgi:hypothetical protein